MKTEHVWKEAVKVYTAPLMEIIETFETWQSAEGLFTTRLTLCFLHNEQLLSVYRLQMIFQLCHM